MKKIVKTRRITEKGNSKKEVKSVWKGREKGKWKRKKKH